VSPHKHRTTIKAPAHTLDCPLCGGKWEPGHWQLFVEGVACASLDDRDVAFCRTYAFQAREVAP
jgi:hypothetical protein